MATDDERLTFSQRNGLEAIPPQLKLGELPVRLRNLLHYPVQLDFDECVHGSYSGTWLGDPWKTILRDFWVRHLGRNVAEFSAGASVNRERLGDLFSQGPLGSIFDFLEFVLQHRSTSRELKTEIARAFIDGRAAYRVVQEKYIVAVGTSEQADAIEKAVDAAVTMGADGAAAHLINAGSELRRGNWAASVRESIHAVESLAVALAPGKDTLGDALAVLEKHGHLHGSLKSAFGKLYGYASDEEGVRHALVFSDEAKVDEADALFMLGACASFASYLIARGRDAGLSGIAAGTR